MKVYKLFRVRRDGSIGSLFINRSQVIPVGVWLEAEEHRTKGFTYRPGWHCTLRPSAPHLSLKGRKWYAVEVKSVEPFSRPSSQGGTWVLAKYMRVLGEVDAN